MSYTKQQLIDMTRAAARKYGIREDVAVAQIQKESSWNPNAVSPSGARGLCQFMPATAARFGLSNPFDPILSLEAWGKYMTVLLKMFNDRYDLALAGYNSGENRAAYKKAAATGAGIEWATLPARVQTETKDYVETILRNAGGALAVAAGAAAGTAKSLQSASTSNATSNTTGLVIFGLAVLFIFRRG